MQPLSTWTCDSCGDPIDDAHLGLVAWRTSLPDLKASGFTIVHAIGVGTNPSTCDPGAANGFGSSLGLTDFLGPDGLARLLSFLSLGPLKDEPGQVRIENFDEFVDFCRRVQTPFYEQARPHFADEETQHRLGDANELYPYLPHALERIALSPEG